MSRKKYDPEQYKKNREKIRNRQQEYYKRNCEKIKQYQKEYREQNLEKVKEAKKIYRKKNLKKLVGKAKKWRQENPEKRREIQKRYRLNNKEAIKRINEKYNRENRENIAGYHRTRRKADPAYKVLCLMRNSITMALKNQSTRKNTRTATLLGCTAKEFAAHIESLFEPWMNWDNHGLCSGIPKTTWHIDHIIPLSKFDLTDPEQQKIAFHYTNCRPLDSLVNVSEGNRR